MNTCTLYLEMMLFIYLVMSKPTITDKAVVAEEAIKVETEESPVAEVKEEAAAYEKSPKPLFLFMKY